jgi:hypothetical protein
MAAYVALFTGLGISLTSASILRTSLLYTSIAALLFLLLVRLRKITLSKIRSFDDDSRMSHKSLSE